jgi:RNA polymerase sigma-70 factor (ECF subfamily)
MISLWRICHEETKPMAAANDSADFEIIRQVQHGDQDAFRKLVERYQAKVHSIIHGILRNREDTEDIAQQVFSNIYFGIHSFDGRCAPLTWIYRIAVNECYSLLRRKRARFHLEGEPVAPENWCDQSHPGADITAARRDFLNKLLAQVPEEERLLLIMKEVEGHSIAELSAMTGRSCTALKTQLFRIRQKLIHAAAGISAPAALTMQTAA